MVAMEDLQASCTAAYGGLDHLRLCLNCNISIADAFKHTEYITDVYSIFLVWGACSEWQSCDAILQHAMRTMLHCPRPAPLTPRAGGHGRSFISQADVCSRRPPNRECVTITIPWVRDHHNVSNTKRTNCCIRFVNIKHACSMYLPLFCFAPVRRWRTATSRRQTRINMYNCNM